MRGPKPQRTERSRTLRKAGNTAEGSLWHGLRNRQLGKLKFVRQFPIGPYFADFACRDRDLVIEVDGSQHLGDHNDLVRTLYMNRLGWSVARFWHADVLQDRDSVLATISAICDGQIEERVDARDFQFFPALEMAPHSDPLPASGERERYMRQAIDLALAQMGRTWPNPSVGCVLVKDGVVIGEGATGDGGRPHAEEIALDKAGEAARGATAYVTLEPCGQRSTGHASCSQRLVEAGVACVIYACNDPSPFASHRGPERMANAGITVEAGLLADEAAPLIAASAHYLRTGLPLVSDNAALPADAVFTAAPDSDLTAELKALGEKGYRRLKAPRDSDLAHALRRLGLLAE